MTTTDTDKQTKTKDEWSYKTIAPEVSAFLRGRKRNLESVPVFLKGTSLKWNSKQMRVDGKRTFVNYLATSPRDDVRAFVTAALEHEEQRKVAAAAEKGEVYTPQAVPTTDKALADALSRGIMKRYKNHLAEKQNLNDSINAAHDGKAWFAEGISRPFKTQFDAAKAWHRAESNNWHEAFVIRKEDANGKLVPVKDAEGKTTSVQDRRKKIIAAANTWQGNADGTKTVKVKTRNGGKRTVKKAEARKPKQVTKANMVEALRAASLEVNLKERVAEVRERYEAAIKCGAIKGVNA